MKNIISLIALTLMLICCDKDDNKDKAPIDQLPPATQVGANTFGCLLDGKAFMPGNLPNSYNCFYQFVDGGFYFYVSGQKYISKDELVTIVLKTENKQIFQGETYDLYENIEGNAVGAYLYNIEFDTTTHIYTGKLTITKLDFQSNIVSGIFWFDVEDSNGVVHQIREGRFDMRFTQ